MSAKQTPMLLGRFVEHQAHFNLLSTADAQWAIQEPKAAATLCVTAIRNRPRKEQGEKRIRKVLLPAVATANGSQPFKVRDTFLSKKNGRVKVSGWGSNFETWFGDKEEMDSPSPLQVQPIGEGGAGDEDIVADLGGEEAAEMAMASFWEKLALQGNGQAGELHVDGRANIGYAKDASDIFRVVYACWRSDGWIFNARGFPYAYRWDAGRQVLSPRNS